MSQPHTCHELGVCNSRHCVDVSACPDYDLLACNDRACTGHAEIAAKGQCPSQRPQRRFTDRPGCASEAYPQPTFPFAPGVIQRQPVGATGEFAGVADGFPLSLVDTLKVLAVVLVLIVAGLVMGGAE
jgi:hypothetical protein